LLNVLSKVDVQDNMPLTELCVNLLTSLLLKTMLLDQPMIEIQCKSKKEKSFLEIMWIETMQTILA